MCLLKINADFVESEVVLDPFKALASRLELGEIVVSAVLDSDNRGNHSRGVNYAPVNNRRYPAGCALIDVGVSEARRSGADAYERSVHTAAEYRSALFEAELRRSARFNRLRSKTVTRAGAEMTYEVRMDQKADLVGRMLDIEGVHDATLVAMNTETGA